MPTLRVKDYRLLARIGCTADERELPQELSFTLKLCYTKDPLACSSDRIEDTLCYAELCEAIKDVVEAQSYSTIEFLTAKALQKVSLLVPLGAQLRLCTQKIAPPIAGLHGGASFEMECTRSE